MELKISTNFLATYILKGNAENFMVCIFGLYFEDTSKSNGKYSNSSRRLVPSEVIILSCFAYSMYDAESNVSHPSAIASGIVSG